MKYIAIAALLLLAPGLSACSKPAGSTARACSADTADADAANTAELPMPAIPAGITDRQEKLSYLLRHFWQPLDFNDTSLSLDTAFMEQNFANFVYLLPSQADSATCRAAADSLFLRASANRQATALLLEITEKYLADPESPMRDDEKLIHMARAAIGHSGTATSGLDRMRYLLENALKNRVGYPATDFAFTTAAGTRGTLAASLAGQPLTLLLFYDPDCANCRHTLEALETDANLRNMVDQGQIAVLAIYPFTDQELWKRSATAMPRWWTVAMADADFDDTELYALPAMPSVYVVDTTGTVLLKDATPMQLAQSLGIAI